MDREIKAPVLGDVTFQYESSLGIEEYLPYFSEIVLGVFDLFKI